MKWPWSKKPKPTEQIRVIELAGMELQPGTKYLMVFNKGRVSRADAQGAITELGRLGVTDIALMGVMGDPDSAVKVYGVK